MCEHKLKFLRQSMILWKGHPLEIDIYQCQICGKHWIINTETDGKISLDGKIGEEIDD